MGIDKNKIRDEIEWISLVQNGLKNVNGAYAQVKNLKISEKKKLARYTLVLGNDMEGTEEIYRNQEYNISKILEKNK